MTAETYRLIRAISTPYIYIYIMYFLFRKKIYLDIMNDSNKSTFYLHLNYLDSTSKSVRRLLKIWETSVL